MKKLLLATLLTASFAAQASNHCNTISVLADKIMEVRQMGADMAKVTEALLEGKNETVNDTSVRLVIEAYSQPRYMTEAMQLKARVDFKNDQYLKCIKSYR